MALEIDRINKITNAVMFGVPADEICETAEERKKYAETESAYKWAKKAGYGLAPINDVDTTK